jgi:predicted membrane channel-forming protein YqfA (hemolysin III family)
MQRLAIYAIVLLWAIAIVVTFYTLKETEYFSKLSSVYFFCMAGSVLVVKYTLKKISEKEKEQ